MKKVVWAGALAALVLAPLLLAGAAQKPDRRHIRIGKSAQAPFSDGVLVGNTLYLSGRLGIDPEKGAIPDDVDSEIRFLLDGFETVLREAGMTMDDLVNVQVFCPDLSLYETFNAAYRKRFDGVFPARAFIGSGALLRGAHFEMQGIAVGRP